MLKQFAHLSVLFGLSGCAAVQASGSDTLPEENVTQCRSLCASAGMQLQSIVIVANQTGCVCGDGASGSTGAAAGGAVVALANSQQQQSQ